jgi:hypothetical protein
LLLAVLAVASCKKGQPPEPRRVSALAAKPSETPITDKMIADDPYPAWIAGTWKKDGEWRWLLFNLPAEAVELAGNPAHVARKGKLTIHGNFISVLFNDAAIDLEANEDHSVLVAKGAGVYRRGSPP